MPPALRGLDGMQQEFESVGGAQLPILRGIETGVGWCTDLLAHMREHGAARLEPTLAAEERWTAHVTTMYAEMLMRKAKSWFTGYNSNVAGHEQGRIRYFVYNGGSPKYVTTIKSVASMDYDGLVLGTGPSAPDTGQNHSAAA